MKSIRLFTFKATVSALVCASSLGMAEYYYPTQAPTPLPAPVYAPPPQPVYMAPAPVTPTTVVNTNTNTNTNPNTAIAGSGAIAAAPITPIPGVHGTLVDEPFYTMRITPMGGMAGYVGSWNYNVKNNYSLGIATEFTSISPVSFEIEGGYSNYTIAYDSLGGPGFPPMTVMHNFDQYVLGGNAKFYLIRGIVRPYVGGGMQAVYYSGMQARRPGGMVSYNELIGAGQLLAGADMAISRSTAFGIRGSLSVPLIDKPYVANNGVDAAPGYEEASLINTAFYKIMGTLTIDL